MRRIQSLCRKSLPPREFSQGDFFFTSPTTINTCGLSLNDTVRSEAPLNSFLSVRYAALAPPGGIRRWPGTAGDTPDWSGSASAEDDVSRASALVSWASSVLALDESKMLVQRIYVEIILEMSHYTDVSV